jgi:hypothetical protein
MKYCPSQDADRHFAKEPGDRPRWIDALAPLLTIHHWEHPADWELTIASSVTARLRLRRRSQLARLTFFPNFTASDEMVPMGFDLVAYQRQVLGGWVQTWTARAMPAPSGDRGMSQGLDGWPQQHLNKVEREWRFC